MNLPANVLASFAQLDLTEVKTVLGRQVPNQQPTQPADFKLAIVGEHPGAYEDLALRPFQGPNGELLDLILNAHGISRNQCFLGYVCSYRPPQDNLYNFSWGGEEIQESLSRLHDDLKIFNPNCILLLGRAALYAAHSEKRSLTSWRGSVLLSKSPSSPMRGYKCIASYTPYQLNQQYELTPLFRFDLSRARDEAESPTLSVSQRRTLRGLAVSQILDALHGIVERARQSATPVRISFDLEGYWNRITRFAIATDPHNAFIVPFTAGEYDSFWSVEDEARIWVAVNRLLTDASIRKVLQNSLYDRFVLAYVHKILISNVSYDTMLGHWELYAELKNNLGLQASIYTKEPFWKEEREDESLEVRELYCGKDALVTDEIAVVQESLLRERVASWNHFQFNMQLLNPLLYMMLRGIKYDRAASDDERAKTLAELWARKHEFNCQAGKNFTGTVEDLLEIARQRVAKKKMAPFVLAFQQLPSVCLKAEQETANRLAELAQTGKLVPGQPMSDTTLGEVESLLGLELNVDSPKQMVDWLYIVRRFKRQYKKDPKTKEQRLTSDVGALLTLFLDTNDPVLKLILRIRALLYKAQVLDVKTDDDGRVRCSYNIVGAETARITCAGSTTGSGYNLQTVTKKLRRLFVADDGYYLFQCDLAGADGWTVAAHCRTHGDDHTMWDDYMYGLKPAKIVARMYMEIQAQLAAMTHVTDWARMDCANTVAAHFHGMSRSELKALCKEVDQDGWLYFACKRVQHGTNYLMQAPTMSIQIMKDSFKFLGDPIHVPISTCEMVKKLYLGRYQGVERWQTWVANHLREHESLTAASGRLRRFFGRIYDKHKLINNDTWKQGASNEPQDNTTYATMYALHRLWHDPNNRDSRRPSGLIIEPLHQVHDALNGQFPIDDAPRWASMVSGYFQNTINIAGVDVCIPFEGAYGRSWGELDAGIIQ